jgi:hypothetical protein
MCLVFTCGEQECTKPVSGYEGLQCQCHHCVSLSPAFYCGSANKPQGNWSATVIKRQPWFTFCFVPIVPLSIHGYDDIVCNICRFAEPLQNRPDVADMARRMQENGGMPMHPQGPNQGWNGGPGGVAAPKPQQQMQYR